MILALNQTDLGISHMIFLCSYKEHDLWPMKVVFVYFQLE